MLYATLDSYLEQILQFNQSKGQKQNSVLSYSNLAHITLLFRPTVLYTRCQHITTEQEKMQQTLILMLRLATIAVLLVSFFCC